MNSHLNYLMANERATDLIRGGEQARLANNSQAIESAAGRRGLRSRTFGRLWLLVAASQRLRTNQM